MTIEMYPSDQVADLRAEVTHWYENLQKEQMNQQAQLQEFGQSGRQPGDFPGQLHLHICLLCFCLYKDQYHGISATLSVGAAIF